VAPTGFLGQPIVGQDISAFLSPAEVPGQGLAVVIQDVNGKTMRREVCEFNNSNDVRNCVDWDSGARHRDTKNTKGDWVQIAGE